MIASNKLVLFLQVQFREPSLSFSAQLELRVVVGMPPFSYNLSDSFNDGWRRCQTRRLNPRNVDQTAHYSGRLDNKVLFIGGCPTPGEMSNDLGPIGLFVTGLQPFQHRRKSVE